MWDAPSPPQCAIAARSVRQRFEIDARGIDVTKYLLVFRILCFPLFPICSLPVPLPPAPRFRGLLEPPRVSLLVPARVPSVLLRRVEGVRAARVFTRSGFTQTYDARMRAIEANPVLPFRLGNFRNDPRAR